MKSGDAKSLLAKATEYCRFYRENRPVEEFPSGVDVSASDAYEGGDLPYLRAISKEIDVRVRDLLNANEQEALVSRMASAGVVLKDLPKSSSLKKVKVCLRRGRINGLAEYELLKTFIEGASFAHLSTVERRQVGEMLDRYQLDI